MVIPRKRSITTLVYKSMKLNFMELAYTEHLTAGTNDINSNNNCHTAKSETQSLILKNVPKIFLCPF